MRVDVREEPPAAIAEYAALSIAFQVGRVLDVAVIDGGFGGFALSERAVDAPYVKDYDAGDGGPARWAERFDLSRWGLLGARVDGRLVGGAAVAFDTPGLMMLEERRDLAVLWDLRVASEARGTGVGAALFRAVEAWAAARGCRQLKVETQNVNVPACRFYARQGCVLGGIHRFAYPGLPHEVQLLWYKDLYRRDGGGTHLQPGGRMETQGWVLYDDACGFCRRWVPFWASTLRRRGFDIAPLQSPWVREKVTVAEGDLLDDLRLLLGDGRQVQGADVYRHVMRRIWWAWPFYVLACAPGLRRVFDGAYRAFATHRHRFSRACGLPGAVGDAGTPPAFAPSDVTADVQARGS